MADNRRVSPSLFTRVADRVIAGEEAMTARVGDIKMMEPIALPFPEKRRIEELFAEEWVWGVKNWGLNR